MSEELWPWAAFLALGVLGVAALAVQRWRARKRSAALEQASLRLGMTFQLEDETLSTQPFFRLPLFRRGHSRRWRDILRGSRGGEVVVFDYVFTVGGGRSSSTYRQTVAALRVAGRSLPEFTLSPETLITRLGERLGMQDIDFESSPAFSRSYRLTGADEAAVRELFKPEALHFFASEKGLWVEGAGEWVIVYRRSRRVSPADLPGFLDQAARVSEVFRRG